MNSTEGNPQSMSRSELESILTRYSDWLFEQLGSCVPLEEPDTFVFKYIKTLDSLKPDMRHVTENGIVCVLRDIEELLIVKNRAYGDSALSPRRIFSKASTTEQLLVRIDDKLSRIATTGMAAADEDTLLDLIGYLVLLRISLKTGENARRSNDL
jgi:hypothetical protein